MEEQIAENTTNAKPRLLLVEQNPVESKLLQELLLDHPSAPSLPNTSELSNSKPLNFDITAVSSLEEAIEQVRQHSFDIALVDAVSRDIQHLGLFHAIKAEAADLPVIILIEKLDQKLLHKAMSEGIQDYLLKQEVDSNNLLKTIHHVILRARLQRLSTVQAQAIPIGTATTKDGVDEVTGLPRQPLFVDCLEYEVRRARRYSQLMALMFIHVEGLDEVKAQLGEEAVAAILQEYAGRLKNILRASDTTGLYKNDEFACILNDLSAQEDVHIIINKVEMALSAAINFQSQSLTVKTKIGLALYPGDSSEVQELIKCAGIALDKARKNNDAQSEIYNSHVTEQDLERFKVADAVRHAMEKKELRLHLQPILNLAQKTVIAVEAMLYWEHSDYAEISSRDILFLAELAGLIQPVEEWLLRQACTAYKHIQQRQAELKLRLHLPSGIFRNSGFPILLKAILAETELAAASLQLAVPVSAIMQSPEKAYTILEQLDDMGISILLDDFGGSRSSMQIIKKYPIKGLIVEDLVVNQIGAHQDASSMVKTIIAMCQALRLDLTAKGVDSAAQETLLANWQCPSVQGEHYAGAVTAEAFFKLPLWDEITEDKPEPEPAAAQNKKDERNTAQRIRDSLTSLNSLPAMSDTGQQLLNIRNNPDADVGDLEKIIEQDPAISAQIIRYANAPFFGNQGQIKTLRQALMTALGFEGALNMALGIAVLGNLKNSSKGAIDMHAFWRHAVYAAALSQAIARQLGRRDVQPGTAWLVGLLQNIGYLALLKEFQPELEQLKVARKQHPELQAIEVEERVLGISHAEVGLHLLRGWQLPEEIVTAVFEHHNVSYVGAHASYANIVLLANRMLANHGIGDETVGIVPFGILQMLSLNEGQLEKIMNDTMDSRDGLDTMGNHLAA